MDTWKSIFCGNGVLLLSAICATLGLQVTIPQSMYEVARGDEVIITCSFQPQNPVNRLIIISWIGEPDGSFDDEGITFGTFYSDDGHVDINAMYEGKVQIESDVSKKVSNLILKQVTLRESRRIKCIVQIPGDTEGRTSDSTSVVVLVAPSNPVCKIKGTAEYGQNISLSCVSEEGSPTPTYQWQSYDVKNIPRSFPPKTTEKDGVLSLFNVSMDTSGYYICTSTNKINSAKCNLTLSVMPSTMKIGATAGIIGGCIAGVAVLVLIIYCACKDKPKPEEFAMEPPTVEYHGIPAEEKKGDERKTSIEGHIDQRERYKMKAEKDSDRDSNHRFDDDDQPPEMHDDHRENYSRDYNEDRRDYYDDRKHQYNDQHNNYDDRRGQYDDRQYRSDGRGHYRQNRYDDRNSFDDRREVYDDRQGRYDNHRYRYADREDHYNDHRERYERQGQYTDCDER